MGCLILTGGSYTGLQVSRWLIFGLTAAIGAFLLLFVGALVRVRRQPAHSGRESLIGAKGKVRSRLEPEGVVWVDGERWDATSEDGILEADTDVVVTATKGLRLTVKRDPASIKLLPAPNVSEQR